MGAGNKTSNNYLPGQCMSTVYIVSENITQNSNFSIKLQKYALSGKSTKE